MIKRLVSVLSGAVLAGLTTYALLELSGRLGLLGPTGAVIVPIWLFVVQFAVCGILSGFFAMLFVGLLEGEEQRKTRRLEERVARLEDERRDGSASKAKSHEQSMPAGGE